MSEQELNKKLAEWAGVEPEELETIITSVSDARGRLYKGGRRIQLIYPDFTNDISACFKWLVPKLKQSLELTITFHRCHGNIWSCILTWYNGEVYEEARHETPALALCRAIEKLIDAEK